MENAILPHTSCQLQTSKCDRNDVPASDETRQFEYLYRSYYSRLSLYLARLGMSHDDAHEVAQDTFIRVYERLHNYRGDAEWAYLKTAARRVMLNQLRGNHAEKRAVKVISINDDDLASSLADVDTPENLALLNEMGEIRLRVLRAAITALPPASSSCLLLSLAGYDQLRIANELGTTPQAVKARLHDARKQLRLRLSGEWQNQALSGGSTRRQRDINCNSSNSLPYSTAICHDTDRVKEERLRSMAA